MFNTIHLVHVSTVESMFPDDHSAPAAPRGVNSHTRERAPRLFDSQNPHA